MVRHFRDAKLAKIVKTRLKYPRVSVWHNVIIIDTQVPKKCYPLYTIPDMNALLLCQCNAFYGIYLGCVT